MHLAFRTHAIPVLFALLIAPLAIAKAQEQPAPADASTTTVAAEPTQTDTAPTADLAAEPPAETLGDGKKAMQGINIKRDRAFERYVDVQALRQAIRSLNASLLTDVAAQFAEGERILFRQHKSISADEVLAFAVKVASHKKDNSALERLSKIIALRDNPELAASVKISQQLASDSRAVDISTALSVVETSPQTFATFKSVLAFIEDRQLRGDAKSLEKMSLLVPRLKYLGEHERETVKQHIAAALESISKADSELVKKLAVLSSDSRFSRRASSGPGARNGSGGRSLGGPRANIATPNSDIFAKLQGASRSPYDEGGSYGGGSYGGGSYGGGSYGGGSYGGESYGGESYGGESYGGGSYGGESYGGESYGGEAYGNDQGQIDHNSGWGEQPGVYPGGSKDYDESSGQNGFPGDSDDNYYPELAVETPLDSWGNPITDDGNVEGGNRDWDEGNYPPHENEGGDGEWPPYEGDGQKPWPPVEDGDRQLPPVDDNWPPEDDSWPPVDDSWPPEDDNWPPEDDSWPPEDDSWPPVFDTPINTQPTPPVYTTPSTQPKGEEIVTLDQIPAGAEIPQSIASMSPETLRQNTTTLSNATGQTLVFFVEDASGQTEFLGECLAEQSFNFVGYIGKTLNVLLMQGDDVVGQTQVTLKAGGMQLAQNGAQGSKALKSLKAGSRQNTVGEKIQINVDRFELAFTNPASSRAQFLRSRIKALRNAGRLRRLFPGVTFIVVRVLGGHLALPVVFVPPPPTFVHFVNQWVTTVWGPTVHVIFQPSFPINSVTIPIASTPVVGVPGTGFIPVSGASPLFVRPPRIVGTYWQYINASKTKRRILVFHSDGIKMTTHLETFSGGIWQPANNQLGQFNYTPANSTLRMRLGTSPTLMFKVSATVDSRLIKVRDVANKTTLWTRL
jgi:hypothetical protein